MQLSTKELLYLDDILTMQQNMTKTLNDYATRCQDPQLKALCQNLANRCQNNFNSLIRHLS
ncbi:MAG TPA: spore coat protein [Caldanaerobacter subterraneus]|nr:spore coat protein [Caldanaerobacter subterraneus]MBE3578836.1 spore coat protein [Caldanaerobacter subterraneus]HBT49266.1 spore coat protein [Caldanaerobacter subterraneus]